MAVLKCKEWSNQQINPGEWHISDSLARFLFLVAAKGLAGLVRNGVLRRCLTGAHISDQLSIPLLQFVDDTNLFVRIRFDYKTGTYVRLHAIRLSMQKEKIEGLQAVDLDAYRLDHVDNMKSRERETERDRERDGERQRRRERDGERERDVERWREGDGEREVEREGESERDVERWRQRRNMESDRERGMERDVDGDGESWREKDGER